MYVARPLSEYIKNPGALSMPPDGPNSGYLVIQDEESETYCCFGLCKDRTVKDLPFPQNKTLSIRYTEQRGQHTEVVSIDAIIIPVLNLPLSSNRYYAIQPHENHIGCGLIMPHVNHIGEAFTSSREEDKTTCCFWRCVKDIQPRPFDPRNIYQQFEISACETVCAARGYFYAKSVAPDGFPPYFMRRNGWSVRTRTPKNYELDEAPGLNAALRARLPDSNFYFPLSYRASEAVVVGKWYSPFMFVKEGTLRDQVKISPFYQVTLEQKWEQIFSTQNNYNEGKSVNAGVTLDREMAYVAGSKALWDERNVVEGAIWFRSYGRNGEETTVGLSKELVQRMKWEQERGGWVGGKERQARVERAEKFEGNGEWREFGCYVLVESFVIRRMDGSVVMTYDFKHTQHIRSRWE